VYDTVRLAGSWRKISVRYGKVHVMPSEEAMREHRGERSGSPATCSTLTISNTHARVSQFHREEPMLYDNDSFAGKNTVTIVALLNLRVLLYRLFIAESNLSLEKKTGPFSCWQWMQLLLRLQNQAAIMDLALVFL